MVRAVIFDMGGVILTSPYAIWADYASECGLTLDDMRSQLRANETWHRFGSGLCTLEEVDAAFDVFSVAEVVRRTVEGLSVRPEMVEATRRIKANGLKIAGLTNDWPIPRVDRGVVIDWDAFVRSSEEGVSKPDARIYRVASERLAVEPEACVFLDDLHDNAEGARAVGMRAIHVTEAEGALAELSAMLGFPLG